MDYSLILEKACCFGNADEYSCKMIDALIDLTDRYAMEAETKVRWMLWKL